MEDINIERGNTKKKILPKTSLKEGVAKKRKLATDFNLASIKTKDVIIQEEEEQLLASQKQLENEALQYKIDYIAEIAKIGLGLLLGLGAVYLYKNYINKGPKIVV